MIELKTEKFQPAFAGNPNFYVALVDDRSRYGRPQIHRCIRPYLQQN